MWSRADVIGLFSNNVVSFSRNVVLRDHLFSVNLVSKPRMLSVRGDYVLSSLQLVCTHFRGKPTSAAYFFASSGFSTASRLALVMLKVPPFLSQSLNGFTPGSSWSRCASASALA